MALLFKYQLNIRLRFVIWVFLFTTGRRGEDVGQSAAAHDGPRQQRKPVQEPGNS